MQQLARSRRVPMVHSTLTNSLRPSLRVGHSRRFFNTANFSVTAFPSTPTATPATPTPVDKFKESRLNSLRDALLTDDNTSRVWAHYTNLLNYFNYDALPLELHQQVLRQCCPPAYILGPLAAKRLLQGRRPETPHLHEGRFQTIISNIRAMGYIPTLEDYHFVLEHFAAVGHHVGSLQVYKELVHLDVMPEPKTFGLCLQAIAHRLTLPILQVYRPRLAAQTRKTLEDLMSDMRKFNVPLTPANLDLALRIFKETTDYEGFDTLVKWAYGIDLANPDRPLVQLQEPHSLSLPSNTFSTHSLNTIINALGHFGNISKMIQAFEVLTQPLPQASQHLFTSFDDDEDFGITVDVPSVSNYSPPYARPNTTTYNMLLQYISQADHATLARHYLLEAMWLDRKTASDLRSQVLNKNKRLDEIQAPHFALNRRMFLSVFGLTNRRKKVEVMHWLSTKFYTIIKLTQYDLNMYIALREQLSNFSTDSSVDKELQPEAENLSPPLPSTSKSFKAVAQEVADTNQSLPAGLHVDTRQLGTAFDIDVNDQSFAPQVKMFNLDLHIRILERNILEIAALQKVVDKVLGRTTQRIKERLGRRVWEGKDIYLSSENRRSHVTRDRWRQIVRFRPRREIVARVQLLKDQPPHTQLSQRTFFTSATQAQESSVVDAVVSKIQSFLPS